MGVGWVDVEGHLLGWGVLRVKACIMGDMGGVL